MSDLTERLRTSDGFKVSMASDGHPYIHADKELLTEAAARIEELEAALRQIAEECPVSITHVWMNTAEVPPVFQQMYDDLAGGDSDE